MLARKQINLASSTGFDIQDKNKGMTIVQIKLMHISFVPEEAEVYLCLNLATHIPHFIMKNTALVWGIAHQPHDQYVQNSEVYIT
jgi:hypothetical protein